MADRIQQQRAQRRAANDFLLFDFRWGYTYGYTFFMGLPDTLRMQIIISAKPTLARILASKPAVDLFEKGQGAAAGAPVDDGEEDGARFAIHKGTGDNGRPVQSKNATTPLSRIKAAFVQRRLARAIGSLSQSARSVPDLVGETNLTNDQRYLAELVKTQFNREVVFYRSTDANGHSGHCSFPG